MSSEGISEMEFDPQIGGWQLLSFSYYCEESDMELLQLLLQIKKAAFRGLQRRRATIVEIPNQNIKGIHKNIVVILSFCSNKNLQSNYFVLARCQI